MSRLAGRAVAPKDSTGDELMTIPDLAEYLGIGVSTIYKYRSEGRKNALPPAIKLGHAVRWRRSTVDAFLASREGK